MTRPEYLVLLDRGYRRSGRVVYQPRCGACTACQSTRVRLADFAPSRSQRRTLRRNADLRVALGSPEFSPERLELHNQYCERRHKKDVSSVMTEEEYRFFMIESPIPVLELTYTYPDGRLAGVALVDDVGAVWSAVFTYFDPDASQRSLGTWSILQTLARAAEHRVEYVHLGFHVAGCRAMSYKVNFRPVEILSDGDWGRG